jgi:hypothetical protein
VARRALTRERLAPLALVAIPALYILTLARGLVPGDPTEYTFVASILGIAHPPGYAFFTLLGKLFQTAIPFGEIPWRTHLLSAVAATVAALAVYGILATIGRESWQPAGLSPALAKAVALFGALTVGLAADFWQHAIHANPHIVTATFLAANLYLLTRWWAAAGRSTERQSADRWLIGVAFAAGLGVTHHPLTVFSWPAYALFVLWLRPRIWREGRLLLKLAAAGLLGLSVWLYYPLRSSMAPAFGPDDMNTLQGFLDHVLARGLTESLPFFGLADQLDRALVFWSLLRLQYGLPVLFLAAFGLAWFLLGRLRHPAEGGSPLVGPGLLFGGALVGSLLFVINLRQQDIMAYLLGVFLVAGLLAGAGLGSLLALAARRLRLPHAALALLAAALLLIGPAGQWLRNWPAVSLRDYRAGDAYVDAVFDWFEGSGEGAVLLNDWEHMTPLWYSQFVTRRWPDPTDVTPRLVATDRPWVESVYDFLPGGPVYLSGYRPEIVRAGFRLRPRGPFYQVVEPGETSVPDALAPLAPIAVGELDVLGFAIPEMPVKAGDLISVTLAMRAPAGTGRYYVPSFHFGEGPEGRTFEFTTDSHLVTTAWQAGEVIVERFEFALPAGTATGRYPLILFMRDLGSGATEPRAIDLGTVQVVEGTRPLPASHLLANFRQRVGLVSVQVANGFTSRRRAPWDEPLPAVPGDTLRVVIGWQSLAPAEESYTVFVHLIDLADRPLVELDYTPLGGSAPTHLWIPKWLPGQRLLDPYRLRIPDDLAPGRYLIEVGLYEMTSGERLHLADAHGDLIGDRYILGPVEVAGPGKQSSGPPSAAARE